MSHDNDKTEAEIAFAIKKIQVLRPKTFIGCSTHSNESIFKSNQNR